MSVVDKTMLFVWIEVPDMLMPFVDHDRFTDYERWDVQMEGPIVGRTGGLGAG